MKKYLLFIILTLIPLTLCAWNGRGVGMSGVSLLSGSEEGGGGSTACSGVKGNNSTADAGYQADTKNDLLLMPITIDCSGTPISINMRTRYHKSASTRVVMCVYADNAGAPGDRLWYGSPMYDASETTATVVDSSIDYSFSAGNYWIGYMSEGPGRWYHSSATGGSVWIRYNSGTFPTPPSSAGSSSTTNVYQMEGWLIFP